MSNFYGNILKAFIQKIAEKELNKNESFKHEQVMATYGSTSNTTSTGYTQAQMEKYLNENFLSAVEILKLDE